MLRLACGCGLNERRTDLRNRSWSGPGGDGVDIRAAKEEAELNSASGELACGRRVPLQGNIPAVFVADDALVGLESWDRNARFVQDCHHHVGLVLREKAAPARAMRRSAADRPRAS